MNARAVALEALLDCRPRGAFVQEILDRHLSTATLSDRDRRLVTQLVYGVLRRRGTLDALIGPQVTRPAERVEAWLWEALRLGAYQLAVLTHVPPHAVVHETVALADRRPQAKGFLNGVLRALTRVITDDRIAGPAADAMPLEDGSYRRLARPVFADPGVDMVEHLAGAFAIPAWLGRRWLGRFSANECVRLGFWFARPAPLWLRANPLRTDRDRLLAALAEAGIAATAGEHPQAVRLDEPRPVRDLPGYADGWFSVQDETAMHVASARAPRPGDTVLDLCAAPGGKSTHLAEQMGDQGRVVACDVDERRLATVTELAARLGVGSVQTCRLGPNEPAPAGPFDAALVDVPCSNTGVLGRRPEARWRLRPDDLSHLAELQARLLTTATERVRPGGVVVYSTCSIEPEENAALVRSVSGLELEAEQERVPGAPADGGYWARLRRR
jgi:16S rRNA (cytosine967-C5)-methyltransferase